MIMKTFFYSALCISAFLLAGCSESPQPAAKKEAAAPPEPVSGQSALYSMYQVARAKLGSDAQVLKLNSIAVQDVPSTPGKSGAWQGTFVSNTAGKARTFTYSVLEEGGNMHKGVYALGDEGWSGKQGVNTSFDIRDAAIDSDAAYKTAVEKAGDYAAKNPNMPISFQLEKISKFTTPVWRVIWGESVGTSSFSVYIDAAQGKFLEKTH